MSGTFPRVIVTLSPTLVSRAEDEIVINPRSMIITRAGCRPETFNFNIQKGGGGTPARKKFILCSALIARRGAPLPKNEIADVLWGEDEAGGPDCWYTVIQVTIGMIRPKLERLGLRIVCRYAIGHFAEPLPSALRRAA